MSFFFTGSLSGALLSGNSLQHTVSLLLAWVFARAPSSFFAKLYISDGISFALKTIERQRSKIIIVPWVQGSDTSKVPHFGCSIKAVMFYCMTAERKQLVSEFPGTWSLVSVHMCHYCGLAGVWQLRYVCL